MRIRAGLLASATDGEAPPGGANASVRSGPGQAGKIAYKGALEKKAEDIAFVHSAYPVGHGLGQTDVLEATVDMKGVEKMVHSVANAAHGMTLRFGRPTTVRQIDRFVDLRQKRKDPNRIAVGLQEK